MSKRINVLQTIGGGSGQMTVAGNPYTVDDGFADETVNRGVAVLVDPVPPNGPDVAFLQLTTVARFTALTTGAVGTTYEITDLPGRPRYRWNGSAFVSDGPIHLGYFLWANLPAAAANPGAEATVTDVGLQRFKVVSDGTYWRAMNAVPLLSQLVDVTVTDASTNPQTCFAFTVPGKLLAPGARLHLTFELGTNASIAVNRVLNVSMGGNGAGQFILSSGAQDARADMYLQAYSQALYRAWYPGGPGSFGQGGGSLVSQAIDLTTPQTYSAAMNFATAGSGANTLTFRSMKLTLEP